MPLSRRARRARGALLRRGYRPALVAAVAVQLATAAPEGAGAAQGAYGPWTAPTLAVEMVCSYQRPGPQRGGAGDGCGDPVASAIVV